MIQIFGSDNSSAEFEAANKLRQLAMEWDPNLEEKSDIVLYLIPSVQCYGQNTRDIDLLVLFADYRQEHDLYVSACGRLVHSFCLTIEVKGHGPREISFDGSKLIVDYRGLPHDASEQSEKQVHAVRTFIERNLPGTQREKKAPWIDNLIWLTRINEAALPNTDNNILPMHFDWEALLDKIAAQRQQTTFNVEGQIKKRPVKCFSGRAYLQQVRGVFTKTIKPTELDRKRMERLTDNILDGKDYGEKLGQQTLIFRGRGGTGKTVNLLKIARQAYTERGDRVLLLTYNKALVADLSRLLKLMRVDIGVAARAVKIQTVHSFIFQWLKTLRIWDAKDNTDNRSGQIVLPDNTQYEALKEEAIGLLKAGAVNRSDVSSVFRNNSDLIWDLILIDEGQDWPSNERDLIFSIYGPEKVVVADGVDQFVRSTEKTDWRPRDTEVGHQIVSLRSSLRLKASLCAAVDHFAEALELGDWHIDPLPDAHGGRVIVVEGDGFDKRFHQKIAATAIDQGNKPVDMLLCVPPSWVEKSGGTRYSRVAQRYQEWGLEVWDGVDPEQREDHPSSIDQFRVVQYESCRGLEGWTVVCFAIDEFYEFKKTFPDISKGTKDDLFYDKAKSAEDYAKRWMMIPLTRAIDTLVLHVSNESSYIAEILKALHSRYPNDVQWLKF